jgi:hypothetical protein
LNKKKADQDAAISEREKEIVAREKEVHDKEQGIEERVQKSIGQGIEKEKTALAKTAREEAEASLAVEMQDLRDEVKSKKEKLEEAQKNEMELRKKERALEDRAKEMDLEVDRKMDAERKRVEEETSRRMSEDHRMKDAEKDKKMSDMMRQIEDLKRKAEQGSQQTQGEVQELKLEKELAVLFPGDNVQPVPKGMNGADVIQEVISNKGVLCGTIIWESKRTKNWSDGWISKLKDDQRAAQADVAVIITQSLPKDIQHFGPVDGVWVTTYACFYGLAYLIRQKLSEIALTKMMVAGKNEKADIIFSYLTGVGFRQRVEAIVEVFSDMKKELDKEKIVTQRVWAKKEKQLQTVLYNTAGLYGDLQGFIDRCINSFP